MQDSVVFDEPDQFVPLLDVIATGLYPCCRSYLPEVDCLAFGADDYVDPILDLLDIQKTTGNDEHKWFEAAVLYNAFESDQ